MFPQEEEPSKAPEMLSPPPSPPQTSFCRSCAAASLPPQQAEVSQPQPCLPTLSISYGQLQISAFCRPRARAPRLGRSTSEDTLLCRLRDSEPSTMEANTAAERKGNISITSTAAVWSCSPAPGGGEPMFTPVRSSVNQHKRGEDTNLGKKHF